MSNTFKVDEPSSSMGQASDPWRFDISKLININLFFNFIFFTLGLSLGLTLGFNDLKASSLSTILSPFLLSSTLLTPPPTLISPSSQPSRNGFEHMIDCRSSVATTNLGNHSLKHNMSDDELMKKASMMKLLPRVEGCPMIKLVPKLAFMFLTKGPLPLSPLWEMFLMGHEGLYSIYIHAHPSYNDTYPAGSVFRDRRIPSQPVEWGTSSMIDAERRLLGNALLDLANQRFMLLSESCIPLYNFTTVYTHLINSNLSFISSFDEKGKTGRGRYNTRMQPNIIITDWRKGWQWFEAHREVALRVVSDGKYYSIFKEHCRPPCYSDEHYLPTLANIEFPRLIANRTLTWVDWSRGGPHPGKFGSGGITDEFLNRIRFGSGCDYNGRITNQCFLFARKFEPSSLEALIRLAPLVFGFGP
ncbi:hypothetical protein Drorol1_Dr00021013 [Drosera rotundifolia]